ncbi:roadblock/LC7 domain-containing protein [Methanobacterium aggregans]|uniref:roadblock/LC7 domain-containing protein n=2 Tax=Methanobacterium aggregans TaxID=1615586 RepID=UPI001AE25E75|nr:roadblock/LC7 domain-containing protein [Methanobacterium aggregans]MBP2044879.1 putative regulator of Ras-like GTPase activity (Roadblock/LC7/MglB family) [Methanobacterium aggregans]
MMNYNGIEKQNSNFKDVLKPLMRISGVKNCIIATMDGMPVGEIDQEGMIISATSAAVLGAITEMVRNINFGIAEKLIVETDFGKIIIEEVGNNHAIVVLTDDNVNIGMIRLTLKKAVKNLQGMIQPAANG